MMALAYIVLVALTGVLLAASWWVGALLAAVLACAVASRFELRWLLDHTPLTSHSPRPVPKHGR